MVYVQRRHQKLKLKAFLLFLNIFVSNGTRNYNNKHLKYLESLVVLDSIIAWMFLCFGFCRDSRLTSLASFSPQEVKSEKRSVTLTCLVQ